MLTAIAIGSAALLFIIYRWRDPLKTVPFPKGIPILGNSLQIRTPRQFLLFSEWAKVHGPIFKLNLSGASAVVLNSFDTVYEALVKKGRQFSGRPTSFRIQYMKNNSAIGFVDPTKKNRNLRKIASSCIKSYGPGLGRLERLSQELTEHFVAGFSKASVDAIDPLSTISNAVTKMMCLIILGEKFEEGSDVYVSIRQILGITNSLFVPNSQNQELDNRPWLRFFGNEVYHNMVKCKDMQGVLFKKLRAICMKTHPEDVGAMPIGHALYAAMGCQGITEDDVQPTIMELLLAGIATMTNTFYSLLNVLIQHPEIQSKLQREVDGWLGQRNVTLADKDHLPYCWATIYEILRFGSNVANDIPHKALEDSTLGGHRIPKGTIIFLNLWEIHHDQDFWGDPHKFRPERFLNEDGSFVSPNDPKKRRVLAFGAGPRICIGEGLAKIRLFIWLVSLMQRFTLKPDPSKPLVDIDPRTYEPGLVLLTPSYFSTFHPR